VRAVIILFFLHSEGYPSITVNCGIVRTGANLSYKKAAKQVSKVSLIRSNGGSRSIVMENLTVKNALCGRLLPSGYMTKLTA
jgi:hypothetical protein